jgi:hypothetical protein
MVSSFLVYFCLDLHQYVGSLTGVSSLDFLPYLLSFLERSVDTINCCLDLYRMISCESLVRLAILPVLFALYLEEEKKPTCL